MPTVLFRNWRVERLRHYTAIDYRYRFGERRHSVWNAAIVLFLRWSSAARAVAVELLNLLQSYVMGRAGGRRLLTTVDRASVGDHPGMISVYHLHGWLDVRDRRELAVVPPPLVFRESEYFDTMANPNSFANYTAQSLFQRRNVLFIGTSLEDVNVRRWLYNSFEERRRHRAQLLKPRYGDYPGAEAEAYVTSIRHFWFKRAKDLPEPRIVLQNSVADAMRHLGVEVIWYEEHSEIADHLRTLSRSPKTECSR